MDYFDAENKDGDIKGCQVKTGIKTPRDIDEPDETPTPRFYRSQMQEERDDYHNDSRC